MVCQPKIHKLNNLHLQELHFLYKILAWVNLCESGSSPAKKNSTKVCIGKNKQKTSALISRRARYYSGAIRRCHYAVIHLRVSRGPHRYQERIRQDGLCRLNMTQGAYLAHLMIQLLHGRDVDIVIILIKVYFRTGKGQAVGNAHTAVLCEHFTVAYWDTAIIVQSGATALHRKHSILLFYCSVYVGVKTTAQRNHARLHGSGYCLFCPFF